MKKHTSKSNNKNRRKIIRIIVRRRTRAKEEMQKKGKKQISKKNHFREKRLADHVFKPPLFRLIMCLTRNFKNNIFLQVFWGRQIMCLNQKFCRQIMCLNHPWFEFVKKLFFFRRKKFFFNRQIIRLNQADHTFKPGRSYF